MNRLNRRCLSALWDMRNQSVKEALDKLSNHPELKFLIATIGMWGIIRFVFGILIGVHVIYYLFHIFSLVLA